MAQECTESSVAISSSMPLNWWDLHHATSLSSLTNDTSPWHQSNPSSNSSCEEDLSKATSFTNASNHYGQTVESARQLVEPASSNELMGEHAYGQLWSHILLGGSNEELGNKQDVGENFTDALSSKISGAVSSGIFGPACDYFQKMDSNWEFTSPTPFNNFEKHLTGFSDQSLIGSGRFSKLASQSSIAPPNPEVKRQLFDPLTCSISLSPSVNHDYSCQHQTCSNSTPCLMGESRNSDFLSCYAHNLKVENEHGEGPARAPFRRSFSSNGAGYHNGPNSSVAGDNSKYYHGMPDATNRSARNFADVSTFSNRLRKPMIDIQVPKPCFKSINNLSDSRNQGLRTSSPTGKGHETTNERKIRKRSEETSETALKKTKHESSTVSSAGKMQAPKVKLSERVTALQQIVSPFGRTDTASVLYEAIQHIKFLQEQVQVLSNPYLTTAISHKDPWVGLDRKDKGDAKLDLRSRGLCLVPIPCTPQIYHDNAGSDYWTVPTYRECLYR